MGNNISVDISYSGYIEGDGEETVDQQEIQE